MGNTSKQDAARILPGDVVQIIDEEHILHTGFALVTETRRWGVKADMTATTGERGSIVPLRLKYREVANVGTAAILPASVLQARGDYLKSLETLAREAQS